MHLETLSYLLRIRADMQRRRLRMYVGDIRVERLSCFMDGYRACLRANGQEASGKDWPAKYLLECHGDQEQAIQKYLDLVAEFGEINGVAATLQGRDARAAAGSGSGAGTLGVLWQAHQELIQGQLDEYGRFFEWLRDVKQEMPGEGWPAKFLRDCHGDYAQAVRQYLDFVAEFLGLSS
ncbi:hypothetical protein [Stigmatella aurantiaca]|nr:hypothetical protein [Stigmatella aurantiaca]